jgi:hypothetical protein
LSVAKATADQARSVRVPCDLIQVQTGTAPPLKIDLQGIMFQPVKLFLFTKDEKRDSNSTAAVRIIIKPRLPSFTALGLHRKLQNQDGCARCGHCQKPLCDPKDVDVVHVCLPG